MNRDPHDKKQRDYHLREAAEALLAEKPQAHAASPIEATLHELQVHQIELELQNEALRQAQAALEESRDRYVDLYDFAPVGYLTLTAEGLIAEINLTAVKLLGVERTKLLQRRFAAWVIPEDQDRWTRFFLSVKELDSEGSVELGLRRGDGTTFDARIDGRTSNRVSALRVAITDITELKKTESRLKESELELRVIIETEPECVKQLDMEGRLLRMNRAGLNMIEADSLDQVAGRSVLEIVAPEYREAFNALTREVFQGNPGVLAFEIIGLKGARRWLESHAVPLRDTDGNIISLLSITRDITERRQMEDQVRQLAFYDPLTGLPNRRLLDDRLRQTMTASKRSGCHGALMFLDLDNFKSLNDALGHAVGDLLLVEVAARLQGCVREADTVARFGGDEFVVVLGCLTANDAESRAQAALVAEKIRVSLAEPYRLLIRRAGDADVTVEHRCTVSVGVTLFIDHDASPDEVIRRADTAMYRAKEAGHNAIRFRDVADGPAPNCRDPDDG